MIRALPMGLLVAAMVASATLGGPAEARIRCNGEYQINSQGEFLTPYCQENVLASVASAHGYHVTGDAIRRSYGVEREACNIVGDDIRIMQFCNAVAPRQECTIFPC